MIDVTVEELRQILLTIQNALDMHGKWLEDLHRSFACGIAPSDADMAENAHLRCAFGQWFHGKTNASLRATPSFSELGELHKAMHKTVRDICVRLKVTGKVQPDDYDVLMGEVVRFRGALVLIEQKVTYTLQNVDSLTGAFNSTLLLPALKEAQNKVRTSGQPYSLLLVDIDVKEINQRRGRDMGDRVLRSVVAGIRETLGTHGKIYRYGGAEFVVCLPGITTEDAEPIKEELLKQIGEVSLAVTGEKTVALQVRYGIVMLDPDQYLEELIDRSARSTYTFAL